MQTITHYMKLFALFMILTLFSNCLYGIDIILDGNISKINGNRDISKCSEGDIFRLSNTTTYDGKPFDMLLHIAKQKNDYNRSLPSCISVKSQTTEHNETVYGITAYLRHEKRPNDIEKDLIAYIDFELIAISKKVDSDKINEGNMYSLGLEFDVLNLIAFDLDSDPSAAISSDDIYVRPSSTVEIGISDLYKIESNKSNSSDYNGGFYQKLEGVAYDCKDKMDKYDSRCRGYVNLKAKPKGEDGQFSFGFRIQNDNPYGKNDTSNSRRKFFISLSKAIKYDATNITDANVTEGTALVHTVMMNLASSTDETYDFNITDITTKSGADYNTSYAFTGDVTYDATTSKITVPAGLTEFNVTIKSIVDGLKENNETYTIKVGTKTATGTIINEGRNPAELLDDTATGRYGNPITVNIVANDGNETKPDTLTLIAASGSTATDEDGDGDIDKIVVDAEGTWTVDNSGKLTFTPETGFTANPTPITYKAKDENGYVLDPAMVRLTYFSNPDD